MPTRTLRRVVRLIVPVVLLALMVLAPASHASSQRYVTVYEHENYQGISERFASRDNDLSNNPVGTNMVTSLRVPAGVTVALYDGAEYTGECLTVTADTPSVVDQAFNDRTSSLKVGEPCPSPTAPAPIQTAPVVAWKDAGFLGTSEEFRHSDADLRDNAIGTDTITSLRLAPGSTAAVYDLPDYLGACVTVLADTTVLSQLNDRATSLRVDATCAKPLTASEQNRWNTSPKSGVELYEHTDYAGASERLKESDVDLNTNRIGAGTVSSLRIAPNTVVALYSGAGFTGECVEVTSSTTTLVPLNFNDRVTSIRIGAGC